MPDSRRPSRSTLIFVMLATITGIGISPSQAQTLTILHDFQGPEGDGPNTPLVQDQAGNFYGTAPAGGALECAPRGGGMIFKMDSSGTVTRFHTFSPDNGCEPSGGVILDPNGNLYGNIANGIYKIDKEGQFTVIYTFIGSPDGEYPTGSLVRDASGNLYGITNSGGSFNLGTVFRIDARGNESVLYSFSGGADGIGPTAGLVLDGEGNLYGETSGGGSGNCGYIGDAGCGTLFKIDHSGVETVLYRFKSDPDGNYPQGIYPRNGVTLDQEGNLYGTTDDGGSLVCDGGFGCGVAFKLDRSGKFTVLHTFYSGAQGAFPNGLVQDPSGNLYGTTVDGGYPVCDCGNVFELGPTGSETVLHIFTRYTDGALPAAGLTRDGAGNFYGTTASGGIYGKGTIFQLIP